MLNSFQVVKKLHKAFPKKLRTKLTTVKKKTVSSLKTFKLFLLERLEMLSFVHSATFDNPICRKNWMHFKETYFLFLRSMFLMLQELMDFWYHKNITHPYLKFRVSQRNNCKGESNLLSLSLFYLSYVG